LTPDLNSEILLNLIRKIKYLTDQFQLCFVFALATPNTVATFYFWIATTIGILTDNLPVATYALSCLCIPVSDAVLG